MGASGPAKERAREYGSALPGGPQWVSAYTHPCPQHTYRRVSFHHPALVASRELPPATASVGLRQALNPNTVQGMPLTEWTEYISPVRVDDRAYWESHSRKANRSRYNLTLFMLTLDVINLSLSKSSPSESSVGRWLLLRVAAEARSLGELSHSFGRVLRVGCVSLSQARSCWRCRE